MDVRVEFGQHPGDTHVVTALLWAEAGVVSRGLVFSRLGACVLAMILETCFISNSSPPPPLPLQSDEVGNSRPEDVERESRDRGLGVCQGSPSCLCLQGLLGRAVHSSCVFSTPPAPQACPLPVTTWSPGQGSMAKAAAWGGLLRIGV